MNSYVFVGDPHVTHNELEDGAALMALAMDRAVELKAKLVILGDLHHNHAVVRVEVVNFWRLAFKECQDRGLETIILRGNHDSVSEQSDESILVAYEDLVTVVDDYQVIDNILFIAYQANNDRFVEICNNHKAISLAVIHQTAIGAAYENGFLAPGGFDQALIPQTDILSGHIHAEAVLGKVHYLGSPRWKTLSDANAQKGIWHIEIEDGKVLTKTKYSTGTVCKQILQAVDTEAQPVTQEWLEQAIGHDLRIDIHGTHQYIEARKLELMPFGAKVRSFKTQDKIIKVKESDGIDQALKGFFGQYQPKYVSVLDDIKAMVKERLQIDV